MPRKVRVRELEEDALDWRFRAAARLVDDLPDRGPGHREKSAGSLLVSQRTAKTKEGLEFQFTDFSAVALSLNIVMTANQRARDLQDALNPAEYETEVGSYRATPNHNESELFDFLEQVMIGVTFAYQALETYCNSTIDDLMKPTDTLPVVRKGKGGKHRLALQSGDIQRQCSTADKLGDILPRLLRMGSPKGKPEWNEFVALERVRHGIVHMKHEYRQAMPVPRKAIDSDQLFLEMIRGDYTDLPVAAVKMLNYFTKHRGTPRWLKRPLRFYGLPISDHSDRIVELTIS